MACFVVGGGEAVAVTAVRSIVKKKEMERGVVDKDGNQLTDAAETGICWTRKLGWLCNMLWGGVILLCIEHIWHGEVVPFPPFLTAMYNAADTSAMLHEMATVGVGMCVMVTVCWAIVTVVADAMVKRSTHAVATEA